MPHEAIDTFGFGSFFKYMLSPLLQLFFYDRSSMISGSRVRITPNTVIFRGPAAYRDIYNAKANVQKGPFYEAWQKDKKGINTFSTRDRKEHAKRRKMLNQSFTEKSLRAAQPFIIKHVDRWNDLRTEEDVGEDQWSEVMNFAEVSDKLVFDIIGGDLCFGTSFDIKEPEDNPIKAIPHAVVQYMQFLYPLTRSPMLELVLWLKPRGLDSFLKAMTPPHIKTYVDFVDDCVAKRLDLYGSQKNKPEDEQRQDIFWFLCDAKNEDGGRAYSASELHAKANMLIVGGTNTTSVTIAAIMFYITRNPVQYNKLVHEIQSKFSSPKQIVHGPKLISCTYLRACINKSIHLSPSGPSELPRQVLQDGAIINGHYYPEGTFYGDSEVFRPDRWIPDESNGIPQEDVNILRSNFHPFAQGSGSCPENNIASVELLITIARTLHRFDVRRPPEDENGVGEGVPTAGWGMRKRNIFQLKDAYISVRDRPMIQFRKCA
ncbi:benzoate 4-monooxygenase cytochrome P450 [Karstenula rhodostoma CBS 690.94]|uniref:Benzoate 4-monooxygenase cytochrome P450 n=1 Tax=Karstenula rhodostoma CBS 690.94 TaxID=1392251 RepID=A0A9P4P8E4_9PLEO|nr:benzoate 4-monooxygenase cytochrome P450 [Karstenula rhodostoma CBS 690.94]